MESLDRIKDGLFEDVVENHSIELEELQKQKEASSTFAYMYPDSWQLVPLISVNPDFVTPSTRLELAIDNDKPQVSGFDFAMRQPLSNKRAYLAVTDLPYNLPEDEDVIPQRAVLCELASVQADQDGLKVDLRGNEVVELKRLEDLSLAEYADQAILKELQELASENAVKLVAARMCYRNNEVDLVGDEKERFKALKEKLFEGLEFYKKFNQRVSDERYESFLAATLNMQVRMDHVVEILDLTAEQRHKILYTTDLFERMLEVIATIPTLTQRRLVISQIEARVRDKMERQNREYFLREELAEIQKELDGGDFSDQAKLTQKLKQKKLKPEIEQQIQKEIDRLQRISTSSPDYTTHLTWLEEVLKLPFGCVDNEQLDIAKARRILERDHYGMRKVKKRILEYLAVRKLQVEQGERAVKGSILCLVGPPGVGKTSIAKSIAEATGRKYIRMSLGGINDESEIRGHRRTYVGALPGRIMKGISLIERDNPLFLLDEIDKLGNNYKGDPSSALLEVLDPEQNNSFRDHYVELPYDLSQVMFVTTANYPGNIPEPLRDRMEIIELSGYTEEEKYEIAKNYLLPKQLQAHCLSKEQLRISKSAMETLISWYTAEAGVRQLERVIARVCRRVAMLITEGNKEQVKITIKDLEKLLGPRQYTFEAIDKQPEVGVVRGLAWTYAGGDTLTIEVNILPGKGRLELTGQLGDVMKESAKAALTYCRSRAKLWKLEDDYFDKHDIHIHVPAGAVPKDGPSAGITMATALSSAILNQPVRNDLAMTGEISLRGRVMPIGGLKEKTVTAKRAKVKQVLIPHDNVRDLEEINDVVKKSLQITPVKTMDDVLKIALLK